MNNGMWTSHHDPKSDQTYYYNTETGITQWENPFSSDEKDDDNNFKQTNQQIENDDDTNNNNHPQNSRPPSFISAASAVRYAVSSGRRPISPYAPGWNTTVTRTVSPNFVVSDSNHHHHLLHHQDHTTHHRCYELAEQLKPTTIKQQLDPNHHHELLNRLRSLTQPEEMVVVVPKLQLPSSISEQYQKRRVMTEPQQLRKKSLLMHPLQASSEKKVGSCDSEQQQPQQQQRRQRRRQRHNRASASSVTTTVDHVEPAASEDHPMESPPPTPRNPPLLPSTTTTTPAVAPHHYRLTKDYIALANDYKQMEQYRSSDPNRTPICILCKNEENIVSKVFFPCEHNCVCDECQLLHNIGRKKYPGSWNFCPLCNEEIKLTLSKTGEEREEYWRWIHEVKPYIPPSFARSFKRQSKAAITRVINERNPNSKEKACGSRACVIS